MIPEADIYIGMLTRDFAKLRLGHPIRFVEDRLLHRSVNATSRELKTGLNIYLTIDFEPV
jgi:hypothetical protein